METMILILILVTALVLTVRYILKVIKGNNACGPGCAENFGKGCGTPCPQKEIHNGEHTIPLEKLFSDKNKPNN